MVISLDGDCKPSGESARVEIDPTTTANDTMRLPRARMAMNSTSPDRQTLSPTDDPPSGATGEAASLPRSLFSQHQIKPPLIIPPNQDNGLFVMTHKARPGKCRVKSGCQTCRIRKVKCDEGFPSCRRCLSTGRKCDGYGIWGGGGASSQHDSQIAVRPALPSAPVTSKVEGDCFQWFKSRSVPKLPGAFLSDFWSTLVLQASESEPAVLHAVLALSSVHRRGIFIDNHTETGYDAVLISQSYIKAIQCLQPHFRAKDRTAFRVALIVCIVFASLEFLRGHFTSAHVHLQMGLNLMRASGLSKNSNNIGTGLGHDPVDDWIVQAILRLHIQQELFNQVHRESSFLLDTPRLENRSSAFVSISDAWMQLQQLMGSIFQLTRDSNQQESPGTCPSQSLLQWQQDIQKDSTRWLASFVALTGSNDEKVSPHVLKVYDLLRVYHAMITIMAATCLCPGDEMIFDEYTDQFIYIITILTDLWKFISVHGTYRSRASKFAMSRSIVDMCWIPPLYYTAIKCRVHRIRIHAILLLEASFHREGLWDSQTAAFAARKVMEIEEGDYYQAIDTINDVSLSSPLTSNDLLFPPLPESNRLRDVQMEVAGDPVETVSLLARSGYETKSRKVLIAQYRLSTGEEVESISPRDKLL